MKGWVIYSDLSGIALDKGYGPFTEAEAIDSLITRLEGERFQISAKLANARKYKRRLMKREAKP